MYEVPAPYLSADGRWWWDGTRWISTSRRSRRTWPRRLVISVVLWGLALCVGPVLVLVDVINREFAHSDAVELVIAFGVGAVATLVPGVVIGLTRTWRLLPLVAACGTGVLALWYLGSMAAQDVSDPTAGNDTVAGVGLVILGLPTFATIAALLGVGAALGAVARRS